METKQFYYVETIKIETTITLAMFNLGALPIVWNLNGMCTLIRVEVVENIISLLESQRHTRDKCSCQFTLYWGDTINADIKYLIV